MPFGGLLTMGIIGGVASLGSGIIGAGAASTAASEQAQSAQQALQFQEQMWGQQQQNVAPYLGMGQSNIGNLMKMLGSPLPTAPTAPAPYTGSFTAPTLTQAQQSPGYQFTAQQGTKGILEAAGAAGGAISGGTLKAADAYNTGLADSTYNDVFNRALSTYGTGVQAYQTNLQQYQAQLQQYNAALQGQQQQFSQAALPVQLGASAASGLNLVGSGVASNAGNLMTQIGNAQAAGTVGTANALSTGLTGATTAVTQAAMLQQILKTLAPAAQVGPYATGTPQGLTPGDGLG